MIPPCQLGIQKLHIHWKYPSGSGFIHTRSDTSRPLRHRQRNDRPSIRRCLPWRHHRVTWITWSSLWRFPHSPNSELFIAPEQYIFIATVSVVKDAVDKPWLSGIEETMVLFAILRAPHDAAYWPYNGCYASHSWRHKATCDVTAALWCHVVRGCLGDVSNEDLAIIESNQFTNVIE